VRPNLNVTKRIWVDIRIIIFFLKIFWNVEAK